MKKTSLAIAWIAALAIAFGRLSPGLWIGALVVLLLSSSVWLQQHAKGKGGWDRVGPIGSIVGGFLAITIPLIIGIASLFVYVWHTTGFAD